MIGEPFLTTKIRIFQSKSDFFPIGKIGIRNIPNSNKFILSEPHINQFSARSENLLGSRKPPIFGTKVDFFPIGKIEIQNVPNSNKFISSEPYMSQF